MNASLKARLNRLRARLVPTTGATVWLYIGHPGDQNRPIMPPMDRAQNVWNLFVSDRPDWLPAGLMIILDDRDPRDDPRRLRNAMPPEQKADLRRRLTALLTPTQRRVFTGAVCVVVLTYKPLPGPGDEPEPDDDDAIEIVAARNAWLESGGTEYEWRQMNLPVRVEQLVGIRPTVEESPAHQAKLFELLEQAGRARDAGPETFRAWLAVQWPHGVVIDNVYERFDRD